MTVTDLPLEPRLGARLVLGLLAAYKSILSPIFTGCCRFEPSCSDYMSQAVAAHGALKGTWLGVRRLARCRPFGGFGPDPCPPPERRSRARRA